ncbi:MAG: glycosyltransferase [Alphaproteobacteria bacterium]
MIVFVNGVNRVTPEMQRTGFSSPLASMRLRCLIPATALAAIGHQSALLTLPELDQDQIVDRLADPAIRIVLGKLSRPTLERHADLCRRALAALDRLADRRPVHADLCDPLVETSEGAAGAYARLLLERCHLIVPNEAMAAYVRTRSPHPAVIVEDPTEAPRPKPPRFAPGDGLTLAWYGTWSASSAALLSLLLADIADLARPVTLLVVAQADAAGQMGDLETVATVGAAGPRRIEHRTWSVETMAAALAEADIAVVPQETRAAWGLMKSHNRLVEAIQNGRLAVASPIPAYQELAAGAWVGETLADGIRWALANPAAALERIVAGQAEVERRFSQPVIARKWAAAVGDVAPASAPAPAG